MSKGGKKLNFFYLLVLLLHPETISRVYFFPRNKKEDRENILCRSQGRAQGPEKALIIWPEFLLLHSYLLSFVQ
jgi:hypothetical protein